MLLTRNNARSGLLQFIEHFDCIGSRLVLVAEVNGAISYLGPSLRIVSRLLTMSHSCHCLEGPSMVSPALSRFRVNLSDWLPLRIHTVQNFQTHSHIRAVQCSSKSRKTTFRFRRQLVNPFPQPIDPTTIYPDMWLMLLFLNTRTVPFDMDEYAQHFQLSISSH